MKHTDIIVILDRSGSMSGLKSEIEGGFDQFIKEQAALDGTCNVTLVQFDSEAIDIVYTGKAVAEVPPMVLAPRGMTPLYDAVGTTISQVDSHLRALPKDRVPDQVLVIIITDGHENASREFSRAQIRELVERYERECGWKFVYLGANVDAYGEASAMGIASAAAANYCSTGQSVGAMYSAVSDNAALYRAGEDFTFTDSQRDDILSTTNDGRWSSLDLGVTGSPEE